MSAEDAQADRSGRGPTTRSTLLPALHAALATWPLGDPEGRALAEQLRAHLRTGVELLLLEEGFRGAAEALQVSVSTLQRWREPGGCLA